MIDTDFGGESTARAHDWGRVAERDAIVAWLRAPCDSPGHGEPFCAWCNVRGNLASEIERGEHHKKKRRRKPRARINGMPASGRMA